jgi:hypothetical protein
MVLLLVEVVSFEDVAVLESLVVLVMALLVDLVVQY